MKENGIKFNGEDMTITKIPEGQICQAFDPIMILPEKTLHIIEDPNKANTSCVAPAFVYLEGSRGKRFLCDYHYYYEKTITLHRTPELWPAIEQFIIDEREKVRDCFDDSNDTNYTEGKQCWCGGQAYVQFISHYEREKPFYQCNFHFRKTYFRYFSNGQNFDEHFDVIDERNKMKMSIIEESNSLKQI